MFFKQIHDKKLAQYSYMVGCQQTGEALVIDPKRIISDYEAIAKAEDLKITKVTETHIHADFASGLREAAAYFQAVAYVSDEGDAVWKYQNMPENTVYLKENDVIQVGNIDLRVLHTPGHTPESISLVLYDRGGNSEVPMGIFTGDFLFVGDVGRPDLIEQTTGQTGSAAAGAAAMYQSLQKMAALPAYMQIWPGHGAGSSCGKALGAVPISTLGYEYINNWAFQYDEPDEFKAALLSDQPAPPSYFGHMKAINKQGFPPFELKAVPVGKMPANPSQLFDLRSKEAFQEGFINGAINIPFNDRFVQYIGWFVDYAAPMTIIADPDDSEAIQKDLASIGYDDVELIIPADAAAEEADDAYQNISPEEFVRNIHTKNILDVRDATEFAEGHLENAKNVHFGVADKADLPFAQDETFYVHCQTGVRSAIAMSVLKARGYGKAVNVLEGYEGIQQALNQTG